MAELILFNKPYSVLSQFTDSTGRRTLAEFIDAPGLYPAGRLDRDSEGLLLLTDDGPLAHRLTAPRRKTWKTYLVQVEGLPTLPALQALRDGVVLKDGLTRPARARLIEPPPVWPRDPPIRYRATIPTRWIELQLREGRNRQVRRMTAAVGHPTLRLIRIAVGPWHLRRLGPGEHRRETVPDNALALSGSAARPLAQRQGAQRAKRSSRPGRGRPGSKP